MSKNDVLQNGSVEKLGLDQDVEAADEMQKMLHVPERKGSNSGIKRTPQLNANLFSKYMYTSLYIL